MNPEAVRKHLQDLVGNANKYRDVLPQVLMVVIEHELWRTLPRANGTPFEDIGQFLTTHFPQGGGVGQDLNCFTYAQLMALCDGYPAVLDVLAEHMPKGKPGRKKTGETIAAARQQLFVDRHKGGNTTAVLQAKLKEHHPDVWADFLAGKYGTSTRAAATAAGLVKDGHAPLPRLKQYWRKASAKERREFLSFLKAEGVGI